MSVSALLAWDAASLGWSRVYPCFSCPLVAEHKLYCFRYIVGTGSRWDPTFAGCVQCSRAGDRPWHSIAIQDIITRTESSECSRHEIVTEETHCTTNISLTEAMFVFEIANWAYFGTQWHRDRDEVCQPDTWHLRACQPPCRTQKCVKKQRSPCQVTQMRSNDQTMFGKGREYHDGGQTFQCRP